MIDDDVRVRVGCKVAYRYSSLPTEHFHKAVVLSAPNLGFKAIMDKIKNILHWLFLVTSGFVFLMYWISGEKSILDYYFSTQIPPEILSGRWALTIIIGTSAAFALNNLNLWMAEEYYKKSLGGRWKLASRSETALYFIDLDTLKSGGVVQAWVTSIYLDAYIFYFRATWSCKQLIEVDCTARTYRFLRKIYFLGMFNSILRGPFDEDSNFEQPIPGTCWESVILAICEENNKRTNKFSNNTTPFQEKNEIGGKTVGKKLPLAVIIVVAANMIFGLAAVVVFVITLAPTIIEAKNLSDSHGELGNLNISWMVNFFYMALFAIVFFVCWTSYYLLKGRNWMRWLWVMIAGFTMAVDIFYLQSKNSAEVTQFFWVNGFLVVQILLLFTGGSNQYFKPENSKHKC